MIRMFGFYKYDIAFSFVAEDMPVIELIVSEFKKSPKIKYYLYTEHEAEQLGEHILRTTRRVYPNSRFVLMVTSMNFIEGFWSRVEKIFLLAYIKKHVKRIIQLKLDNTKVDGIDNDLVHLKWRDDPERIAGLLVEKISMHKRWERRMRIIATSIFTILICLVAGWYFQFYLPLKEPGNYPFRRLNPVLVEIKHNGRFDKLRNLNDSFYINETEVTVGEYRRYCDSTGQPFPPQPEPVLNNHPVVNINWEEAIAFCNSLGGRLPSEVEWEYAASANLQTKYAGGNNAEQVAVYKRKYFRPVATRNRNAFGFYDMSGNVAEWTSSSVDSTNRSKIVKGGSHLDGVSGLQLAVRDTEFVNIRSPYIGFRIAWDNLPKN